MSEALSLAGVEALLREGLAEIDRARDAAELDALRVRYVGRRGLLTGVLRGLGGLDPARRAEVGQAGNAARARLEEALAAAALRWKSAGPVAPGLDLTLPGRIPAAGTPHLLREVEEEICGIFRGMGFTVALGPDVEDEYHNFEALNMPADHPARESHDTFFLADGVVLRTHTSPVQVRVMKAGPPPVRHVFPGRVYRNEAADATHAAAFHQVEVLYVDRHVTMADLKGCLGRFAREMFGEDVRVRLRPSYFPFTEPSAELDISCFLCGGRGCRACKRTGWLELLGCGMVHPAVFENVGYDPGEWTGYAAGMGVDRIVMMKYGIPDIRLLMENDLRVLHQFG
jgi:phenylalanyl-tRNA synthetase alpha chain